VPARIVLIDSGIDPWHPDIRGRGEIHPGVHVQVEGPVEGAGARDLLGHGTAVAAAILDVAPGIEIVPLRVFDGEPRCDFARVLLALELALLYAPVAINLSLGTTSLEHRPALRALVDRARRAAIRLVAPASLSGLPCDPGSLPGVDAVAADPNVPRELPEQRVVDGRSLWFGSPLPALGSGRYQALRARGESLATGYVTGFLARTPG
jgi:membrane-anchored mycosin MYCP